MMWKVRIIKDHGKRKVGDVLDVSRAEWHHLKAFHLAVLVQEDYEKATDKAAEKREKSVKTPMSRKD